MTDHFFFISIIIILLIILLFKIYLDRQKAMKNIKYNDYDNDNDYDYPDSYKNENNYTKNNYKFEKMLEEINKDTMAKINNAVEQGYIEGFQAMNVEIKDNMNDATNIGNFYSHETNSNSNNNTNDAYKNKKLYNNKHKNDNIISYLNKDNSEKLMLFYKPSCPYCSDFMSTWHKIINNLSNNVLYEEIDCEKDYKKANEYKITSVPTIILLVNNEKKMYMGDRNYSDIMVFLKYNGVNLIDRTFENFDSTGYSNDTTPTAKSPPNICLNVNFDTKTDIAQDKYMFQIFNENGQYGYADGGNNPGNIMSPFAAAYSTVDSYLSSLPEGANISECAKMYADQIRGFGLCDKPQLDNILKYQTDINNNTANYAVDGTDYSSNNKVITAIKTACKI